MKRSAYMIIAVILSCAVILSASVWFVWHRALTGEISVPTGARVLMALMPRPPDYSHNLVLFEVPAEEGTYRFSGNVAHKYVGSYEAGLLFEPRPAEPLKMRPPFEGELTFTFFDGEQEIFSISNTQGGWRKYYYGGGR